MAGNFFPFMNTGNEGSGAITPATAAAPTYGVRFTSGSVRTNMQTADYDWQSTTPTIASGIPGYAGNTLQIIQPTNGAQNPAPGASAGSGTQRCEMEPDLTNVSGTTSGEFGPGQYGYFGVSFRLSSDWPINSTQFSVVTQLKNEGSGSPPIELKIDNGKLYLDGNSGSWSAYGVPLQTQKRYDVMIGIRFAETAAASSFDLWINGTRYIYNQQPVGAGTLYSGALSYWKFGSYRSGSNPEGGTVNFGAVAFDLTPEPVLYYLATTP